MQLHLPVPCPDPTTKLVIFNILSSFILCYALIYFIYHNLSNKDTYLLCKKRRKNIVNMNVFEDKGKRRSKVAQMFSL